MTEGSIRAELPRFKNSGFQVSQVANVAREKIEGKLPPLMPDTRANYLARIEGNNEDIYVKAAASPWTGLEGIHLLVIPDRKDYRDIPGVADLSPEALGKSLQVAESLANSMLTQPGISEVDFGINHTRAELKRVEKVPLASFPRNLHIHVTAYNPTDMKAVTSEDIIKSADLTGRTEDALYALGEGLFFGEIVPELRQTFPSFDTIFAEISDQRGRRRFKMLNGRDGFQNPELPKILQAIDGLAKQKYDELAKCFFEFDNGSNQFVTKQDQSARYQLLPRENRVRNVDAYIGNHQNLSSGVKLGLKLLAAIAKDEGSVVERELAIAAERKGRELTESETESQIGIIANRFWAYKDLAYAMVWSAKKAENGEVTWIFGFDPKVFTIHGPHQSSAYTNKLVERDISGYFSHEQLLAAQEREKAVLLQTKEEIPGLKARI